MYMTRTGAGATDEQRAAAFYLGSLEDPLAPWVQATGPIDPYEMHLPVTVKDPVEWLSFSIVSRQISMAAATAIFSRLLTALGGGFAPERVIAAEDATLLGAGLSHAKVRAVRGLAEQVENGRLEVGKFRTMPDKEIESELVAVPGIGDVIPVGLPRGPGPPRGELIPACRREVAPGALRARPGAQARPPATRG